MPCFENVAGGVQAAGITWGERDVVFGYGAETRLCGKANNAEVLLPWWESRMKPLATAVPGGCPGHTGARLRF